jgi:hypothetical protein
MYQQKTNKQVFTWLNLTQEMLNPVKGPTGVYDIGMDIPPRKEEGYHAYV